MVELKNIVIFCKYCNRKVGCIDYKGDLNTCNDCIYKTMCFLEEKYEIRKIGTCLDCASVNTLENDNDKFHTAL